MSAPASSANRVRVDGKFFRLGDQQFYPKGLTYGSFAPGPDGVRFPAREQVAADFAQMRALNANTLRIYTVPPRWLLDLAQAQGLKVLVDLPWWKTGCFLDSEEMRAAARKVVSEAVVAVIDQGLPVAEAVERLLARDPRAEH